MEANTITAGLQQRMGILFPLFHFLLLLLLIFIKDKQNSCQLKQFSYVIRKKEGSKISRPESIKLKGY